MDDAYVDFKSMLGQHLSRRDCQNFGRLIKMPAASLKKIDGAGSLFAYMEEQGLLAPNDVTILERHIVGAVKTSQEPEPLLAIIRLYAPTMIASSFHNHDDDDDNGKE